MLKLKLQYSGYLTQRSDSLEKTLMLGKVGRQEKKGTTEDEMVGWHHQLNGHEFEQVYRVTKSGTQVSNYITMALLYTSHIFTIVISFIIIPTSFVRLQYIINFPILPNTWMMNHLNPRRLHRTYASRTYFITPSEHNIVHTEGENQFSSLPGKSL